MFAEARRMLQVRDSESREHPRRQEPTHEAHAHRRHGGRTAWLPAQDWEGLLDEGLGALGE